MPCMRLHDIQIQGGRHAAILLVFEMHDNAVICMGCDRTGPNSKRPAPREKCRPESREIKKVLKFYDPCSVGCCSSTCIRPLAAVALSARNGHEGAGGAVCYPVYHSVQGYGKIRRDTLNA